MERKYLVKCFYYTSDGMELWKSEYFASHSGAMTFVEFYSSKFDCVQIFKVK